ncbi:hypothetical protein [Agrobacterium salinitolerans]|uniref:hypothetical protein n=1 Tax=Agrobacterium salinitolerans TaxID=1183413 RepID=UPI0022B84E8B|nr:hypothetical protein [Agrobacterium salinitolerans]MCZ7888950.1 hypothetical protein [Agrobacterium salinitolerans]
MKNLLCRSIDERFLDSQRSRKQVLALAVKAIRPLGLNSPKSGSSKADLGNEICDCCCIDRLEFCFILAGAEAPTDSLSLRFELASCLRAASTS